MRNTRIASKHSSVVLLFDSFPDVRDRLWRRRRRNQVKRRNAPRTNSYAESNARGLRLAQPHGNAEQPRVRIAGDQYSGDANGESYQHMDQGQSPLRKDSIAGYRIQHGHHDSNHI